MRRVALTFAAALVLGLAAPAGAGAALDLQAFDVSFLNREGDTVSQAGSHPYAMVTSFEATTEIIPEGPHCHPAPESLEHECVFPTESPKDLELFQVPGFIGDTGAVPKCSTLDFLTWRSGGGDPNDSECPNASAVGLASVEVGEETGKAPYNAPVYNLEPSPGSAAKFGFSVQHIPVTIEIRTAGEAPYEVEASSTNISQGLEFFGGVITLWGVPADKAHDEERGHCYKGGSSCAAGGSPQPFLTLPRACRGPLSSVYKLDSWQHPGIWAEGFALTHEDAGNPQGMTGCGRLGFAPTTTVVPSSTSAQSASGIDVGVNVNDENLKSAKEGAVADADIEKIVTRFPVGVTANPSAAEGLGVCTLGQYKAEALETAAGAGCPDASKLGSVEVETPILPEHPLHGALYLASQDDNPFDSLLALYLVIRDEALGVFIKQAGEVQPEEGTGRLTTTFADLPSYPIAHLTVHLRSGPRAPLITPPTCGTFATEVELTPSSGAPPIIQTPSFTISSGPGGSPCPAGGTQPFAPGFEAGSTNNAAGRYSPFVMRLTRQDAEQDITRFSAVLPPGVVAKIAGVAKCSDAAIAAAGGRSGRAELASPSCPAASEIGHVLAGAGVGTALTYVPGSLYLAGPFGGDPLSVVAIVPAVAGPFDVGTVVTRVALTLNPLTGEGEVDGSASDPIPHILKGLPLAVREVRVMTDRPNFTLNATSCRRLSTRATIFGGGANIFSSADDSVAAGASRYQASSCASLAFKPKLALSLKGATGRSGHPALRVAVTYPPGSGYANIGGATVTLPRTEFIDNAHINNPCTRVQYNANQCPANSVLGTAKAVTPLLDEPLEGPVYFRSNGGERKLPDVVVDLHGQFRVTLVIAVFSKHGRLVSRLLNAPDAPVSQFTLRLFGGKRGLLENSADLCEKTRRVKVQLTGQNGRKANSEPVVATSCKSKRQR